MWRALGPDGDPPLVEDQLTTERRSKVDTVYFTVRAGAGTPTGPAIDEHRYSPPTPGICCTSRSNTVSTPDWARAADGRHRSHSLATSAHARRTVDTEPWTSEPGTPKLA